MAAQTLDFGPEGATVATSIAMDGLSTHRSRASAKLVPNRGKSQTQLDPGFAFASTASESIVKRG